MDHLERIGTLRRLLATVGWLTVAALAAGCVADDEGTASLAGDDARSTTLPPVTASASTGSTRSTDDEPTATSTSTTEPLAPLETLAAELVVDGFDQPIFVSAAPGTDALFVVEREGVVKVVADGEVASEPFLDLRDRLLSSSIEQGLLGLAFHPEYATNGRFFVYYTALDATGTVEELSAPDPTVADPASGTVVLEVPQPAERHNAGMLQFGPDGHLYLSLGDGGAGGDDAQDRSNLLGTIVRLDVSEPGTVAVPDDNPFGDEIWMYGLRNPWRFTIDPDTGLVYIGDVGQEAWEEINVVPLDAAGTNFGWSEMEGDGCFRSGCDPARYEPPALQYSHAEGCSVTGGYVYRGRAIPEFTGHYFFADWCRSFVRSFRYDGGVVRDQFDWTEAMPELGQVTSFGLDADGELLVVNWDGELFRIVPVR